MGPPRGPAGQGLTGPLRPGTRFGGSPGLFMSEVGPWRPTDARESPRRSMTDGGEFLRGGCGYEADGLAAGLPESDGLGLAGLDGLVLEPEPDGALLGAACDGAAVGAAVGATGDGVGVALGPHAAMEAAMARLVRSRFTAGSPAGTRGRHARAADTWGGSGSGDTIVARAGSKPPVTGRPGGSHPHTRGLSVVSGTATSRAGLAQAEGRPSRRWSPVRAKPSSPSSWALSVVAPRPVSR